MDERVDDRFAPDRRHIEFKPGPTFTPAHGGRAAIEHRHEQIRVHTGLGRRMAHAGRGHRTVPRS